MSRPLTLEKDCAEYIRSHHYLRGLIRSQEHENVGTPVASG